MDFSDTLDLGTLCHDTPTLSLGVFQKCEKVRRVRELHWKFENEKLVNRGGTLLPLSLRGLKDATLWKCEREHVPT